MLTRRMFIALALAATTAVSFSLPASEAAAEGIEKKTHDFHAKDSKDRKVKTTHYRGQVLLVVISGTETRDAMRPVTKELILKYGHNKDVGLLTLVDLRELSFYKRPFANGELAKVQDRTAKRMNKWLRKDGQAPIPGLDRKLHIIADFDGKLIKKFKPWKTEKVVTIAVVNKQGDIVGKFKHTQLDQLHEAIDASVKE
jgi:glutathione peroxidase-family protein